MALIPAPKPDTTTKVVEGAVRAVRDPVGAFERATAAVRSRNLGDDMTGIARGAARAADAATGGMLTQAKEVYGSVKEGWQRGMEDSAGIGEAAGTAVEAEEALGTQVSGAVGGLLASVLRPSDGLPQWGNLSSKLIARLYPCDSAGVEIVGAGGASDVRGPVTEAMFEASLNWQSPFENSGPESKAPALMAMLQTGQIATVANALQAVIPGDGMISGMLSETAEKTAQYARELEGRTGITKLNSRQVFSGMPPIKLTMVLHFRAVTDPETEVMQPYQRLLEWALPKQLAKDGVLAEVIKTGTDDLIKALFPSLAPQMVGFTYGNNRYSPMVIESIGNPIDGPMGPTGLPIYRAVQLTLATLTALDKNDVAGIFSRSSI